MGKADGITSRVEAMSAAYRRLEVIVSSLEKDIDALEAGRADLEALRQYQESGQWLNDYEADEAKRIPEGCDRAVLSEDGLYNLLSDIDSLVSRLSGISC